MFEKIVDVLREVFWLKKKAKKKSSPKKSTQSKASAKSRITSSPKSKPAHARPKPSLKNKPKDVFKDIVEAPPKKLVSKKQVVKKAPMVKDALDLSLKPVGEITHYFDRIKVAVLKVNHGTILVGDKLTVVSGKAKFVQKVWSMQVESQDVKVAKKGTMVGIKIDKPVLAGDIVFK